MALDFPRLIIKWKKVLLFLIQVDSARIDPVLSSNAYKEIILEKMGKLDAIENMFGLFCPGEELEEYFIAKTMFDENVRYVKNEVDFDQINHPDKFIDSVTFRLMGTPVLVKGERHGLDADTVLRILNERGLHPFTREVLDIEDIEVDTEVLEELKEYINEVKKRK